MQAAIKQFLEPILEARFWHVSYGFRPGRGCQGALEHIRMATRSQAYRELWNWITDIRSLRCAWDRVARNKGKRTPGIDGKTVGSIRQQQGAGAYLGELHRALRRGAYRPRPCRATHSTMGFPLSHRPEPPGVEHGTYGRTGWQSEHGNLLAFAFDGQGLSAVTGEEGQGGRSLHSSPRSGKPATWRRGTGGRDAFETGGTIRGLGFSNR